LTIIVGGDFFCEFFDIIMLSLKVAR